MQVNRPTSPTAVPAPAGNPPDNAHQAATPAPAQHAMARSTTAQQFRSLRDLQSAQFTQLTRSARSSSAPAAIRSPFRVEEAWLGPFRPAGGGAHRSAAAPQALADLPRWRQPLLDAGHGTLSRYYGEQLEQLQHDAHPDRGMTLEQFNARAYAISEELDNDRQKMPEQAFLMASADLGLQFKRMNPDEEAAPHDWAAQMLQAAPGGGAAEPAQDPAPVRRAAPADWIAALQFDPRELRFDPAPNTASDHARASMLDALYIARQPAAAATQAVAAQHPTVPADDLQTLAGLYRRDPQLALTDAGVPTAVAAHLAVAMLPGQHGERTPVQAQAHVAQQLGITQPEHMASLGRAAHVINATAGGAEEVLHQIRDLREGV